MREAGKMQVNLRKRRKYDENEQCRAPINCNSNVDCDVDEGEICKDDPTTGLKICVSPVDLIKVFFSFLFLFLLP